MLNVTMYITRGNYVCMSESALVRGLGSFMDVPIFNHFHPASSCNFFLIFTLCPECYSKEYHDSLKESVM